MIRREIREDIHVIWLERGKANALDPQFLRAIRDELTVAEAENPRGLVLTSTGSIFCAGLDLVSLLDLDRDGMRDVLDALYECSRAIFAFPRPVGVAINGHAIAGGAYLSLCGDFRMMAHGNGRWGLNESTLR